MLKKLCLAIYGLCAALYVSAQQPEEFYLWQDAKPDHTTTLAASQTISESGHVVNSQTGRLFVFPADKAKNSGKAVLICPGGGYSIIAIEHEGYAFARWLASEGVTAGVLEYRIPNGVHQIPLEDARRGLEIMRQNSQKWGYSADRVGVMGFSAGGHLASTLSVRSDPAFSILFYPVISADARSVHSGSYQSLTGGEDSELYNYYSNELHVTGKTPPALLLHSADDTGVPIRNSELYRDSLLANGVAVELIVYPTGGHGWGFSDWFEYRGDMKRQVLEWILKQ